MCFGIGRENDDSIFDGIKLPNNCEKKILGVMIDNERKFNHILGMYVKQQQKNQE